MNEPQSDEPLARLRTLLAGHETIERSYQRWHSRAAEWRAEAAGKLEEAAQQAGVEIHCDELAPIALPPDSRVDTEAMEPGQSDALELAREIRETIGRVLSAGSELELLHARMHEVPEDVAQYLKESNPDRERTPEERKKADREHRAWRRRYWISECPSIPIIPLIVLLTLIVTALKLSTGVAPTKAGVFVEEQPTNAN